MTALQGVSHPLLGKKHSLSDAQHTLKLVLRAVRAGDLRLAVSRGITAVIQASSAAVGASASTIEKAEAVVDAVRKVVQGAVISKMNELGAGPRWRMPDPSRPFGGRKRTPLSKKDFKVTKIAEGTLIHTKAPWLLETFLMRGGVPGEAMRQTSRGLIVDDGIVADQTPTGRKLGASQVALSLINFALTRWSGKKGSPFRTIMKLESLVS